MGNTDSSVIKLPNGYRLNKIDDCAYEFVKIDDSRKEISCLLKAGQEI